LIIVALVAGILIGRSNEKEIADLTTGYVTDPLEDEADPATPEEKVEFLSLWPTISDQGDGVVIKQDGDVLRFAVIIDPNKVNISVVQPQPEVEFLATIIDDQEPRPLCGFSGGLFETDSLFSPAVQSLPLVENFALTPGVMTSELPSRILYINGSELAMSDIDGNTSVKFTQWAITGVDPHFYAGSTNEPNRTVLALHEGNLVILVTTFITMDEIVEMLVQNGVDPNEIIALDVGSVPKFQCYGFPYFDSSTIVGSAILISP